MTAQSIPPVLDRRDGFIGEHDVWQRLRDGLPDGTVLLCGVKVPQGPSGRQIDFLVLWPGVGIGVVEVKGGAVSCEQGRWRSHRQGETRDIGNPMEQVETVRHELHRFLVDSGLSAGRARLQHLVVLPHTGRQPQRARRSGAATGRARRGRRRPRAARPGVRARGRTPLRAGPAAGWDRGRRRARAAGRPARRTAGRRARPAQPPAQLHRDRGSGDRQDGPGPRAGPPA
ncbi:MAG: NERD domain-containing protein, partial [Pseudorhodobacter sp.]|nr:NERD domain-containing protein [Frankiaceae bacterium]